MLRAHLPDGRAYRILCLGAHSDDIEIGCGGTLLKWLDEYNGASVHWVVFGAHGERAVEARASACDFLERTRESEIVVKDFRDGFFPYMAVDIKEFFEELKTRVSPDIVFTHYRHDRHQDHRLISDLTWNTFRDHLVLEYEIPKYDGDLGVPNVFVQLDEATCERKIDYLLRHFQTQTNKHWFSRDTFLALLRLRGMESNAPHKYAEAFYGRKVVL